VAAPDGGPRLWGARGSHKGLPLRDKPAHYCLKMGSLFTRRAFFLPGSAAENVSPLCGAGGGGVPVELHALDVRGLQPFRTGLHFEADSCAFL